MIQTYFDHISFISGLIEAFLGSLESPRIPHGSTRLQPCQRPASLAQPTRLMPTKLDEHPDFMAANQPPLYLPPPTEFEYNEVNWPFLPTKEKENKLSDILSDLPSQEEFDSYLYPGSVDLHDVLAQGCQQFPSMS